MEKIYNVEVYTQDRGNQTLQVFNDLKQAQNFLSKEVEKLTKKYKHSFLNSFICTKEEDGYDYVRLTFDNGNIFNSYLDISIKEIELNTRLRCFDHLNHVIE